MKNAFRNIKRCWAEVRKLQSKYVIVKYLRLSIEDGDSAESDSIKNQRSLLDTHISFKFRDRKYEVIELIDDGYTGTNLDRPSFKKLLVLAETQQIQCIIVKDFSRFARDYIEVGRYMDIIFPKLQIRFISVNDNYDSDDYIGITGGLDLAVQNLAYAMYSQDLSEKIKSVRKLQHKRGEFLSPFAFYGYMKDSDNPHHLVIDKEAAEVVKKIFLMSYQGMGTSMIAKKLNNDKVLSPREYKQSKGIINRGWTKLNSTAYWEGSMISKILSDERYTGKLVAGKFKKAYVGSKKVIPVPEDEIVVVENTHEAIISQELFNEVQKKRICQKRIQRKTSLFGGLLRCGDCGRTLSYSCNDEKKRRYYCRFYNISGNMECLHDSITYKEVVEVVSEAVKAELTRAADIAKMKAKFEENSKIYRGKLQQMQQSIKGLSRKKAECYIKLTKGEINEAEFLKIKHNIEMQVDIYKADIQKQEEKSLSLEETSVLNLFEKYIGITELTNEMLSDVIKAIYVYNGKRIKIVWNFRERLNECV